MSQAPPPPSMPYQPTGFPQPGQPRSNGLAIASLICGIVGCVPVVTSLAAIILGILGIKKAKEPHTGGRGLAIAGLVLGILGLLIWGGLITTVGTVRLWGPGLASKAFREPARLVGSQFVQSVTSDDPSAAQQHTTGNLSSGNLAALGAEMKSYGKFKSMSIGNISFDPNSPDKKLHLTIDGTITFDNATKNFSATLLGDASAPGAFRIDDFKLQ